MHQNVDGLINKSELVSVVIDYLASNGTPLDVMCFTEHNMIKIDTKELSIINYSLISFYSREGRSGGACILVYNNHECKVLLSIDKHCVPDVLDCCAVEIVEHNLIIVRVYRPPRYTVAYYDNLFASIINVLREVCCKGKKS